VGDLEIEKLDSMPLDDPPTPQDRLDTQDGPQEHAFQRRAHAAWNPRVDRSNYLH
jgi:hypothetical protein